MPSTSPEDHALTLNSQLEEQIRDLEVQRFTAMLAADVDTLDRLCHDNLIYTHSTGTTDTKADFLDRLSSGSLRYSRLELEIRTLRVVGGTAVILEVMDASVQLQDTAREVKNLGLAVWARDADQWRLLAYHPLPQH